MKMHDDGIIRPSMSQWNMPLLVIPKKTDASGKQKLRIVVDFRKLNDLTIEDSFPLPNIIDILDQLENAKYFSTLDLASGYHQIPMHDEYKNKTAFSTSYGRFEFNRIWIKKRTGNVSATNKLGAYRNPGKMSHISRRYSDLQTQLEGT